VIVCVSLSVRECDFVCVWMSLSLSLTLSRIVCVCDCVCVGLHNQLVFDNTWKGSDQGDGDWKKEEQGEVLTPYLSRFGSRVYGRGSRV